ncbi:MAG TPA: hypothetical protein VI911_08380 [Patescibacteria group bacterium]|nr:hypothetical protein [Patescibacteria group bacterium]
MFSEVRIGDRVWDIVYGWGKVRSVNAYRERFKVVFIRTYKELQYCYNGRLAPKSNIDPFNANQSLFWVPFDICPSLAALTGPRRAITKWRWVVQGNDFSITDDYYESADEIINSMPSVKKVIHRLLSTAREFNDSNDE